MNNEPTPFDDAAITRANVNLMERLFSEGVTFAYDEDGDTLFITIGEGRHAVAVPIIEGIYYRIDPETLEFVGATIVGFVSDVLAHNKLIRRLVSDAFDELRRQGGTAEWKGAQAQRAKIFFDLTSAGAR